MEMVFGKIYLTVIPTPNFPVKKGKLQLVLEPDSQVTLGSLLTRH